jgi:hypothetical protein
MSEVILQLNDTITFEKILALLAPYIQQAKARQVETAEPSGKIWDGRMDCLQHPWKTAAPFAPLSREAVYER